MAKTEVTPHPGQPSHDPLADALGPSPLEQFLNEHKMLIGGGIAAVLLGVTAAIWFNGAQEEAAAQLAQAFSAAQSVSDFDALIAKDPVADVAANALLRKAALLEEDGKKDEAQAALTELRQKHPRHPLVDQASIALARLAADEGRMDEARDLLAEIPGTSDLAALAQLKLGDLAYRQGDLAKAKSIYEPIQANFPVNPWSQQVQERLQGLKLDEARAKIPAPPVAATPPAAKPAPAPVQAPAPAVAKPAPEAPKADAPKPPAAAAKPESAPAAPAKK
jgi:predicted negative regulator of RcsB-dependent stress response